MTPDGRDGFSTLMLRRGWSSYVIIFTVRIPKIQAFFAVASGSTGYFSANFSGPKKATDK